MGTFAGTAEYYDKFRPGVPGELVMKLLAAAGRDAMVHSLLDLGAGTGKVTEQFLPYFKDIVVVEPEIEMLELAKKRLVPAMPADASIYFLNGSAEVVQYPPNWTASLVIMCRSFHWMDRQQVLKRLDDLVEARGVVAIFGDKSFWTQETPWMVEVRRIVQSFLGEQRRAGAEDFYNQPDETSEDLLRGSAFSAIEQFRVPVRRVWNAQSILGYLYSTSFAAKGLFGENVDEFEMMLGQALRAMEPEDKFIEQVDFEVTVARRPQ